MVRDMPRSHRNSPCLSFPTCEMGVAGDASTQLPGLLAGRMYLKCLAHAPGTAGAR